MICCCGYLSDTLSQQQDNLMERMNCIFMTCRTQHQTSFTSVFMLTLLPQRNIASITVGLVLPHNLYLFVYSMQFSRSMRVALASRTCESHFQRNSMLSFLQHVYHKGSRNGRQPFFPSVSCDVFVPRGVDIVCHYETDISARYLSVIVRTLCVTFCPQNSFYPLLGGD